MNSMTEVVKHLVSSGVQSVVCYNPFYFESRPSQKQEDGTIYSNRDVSYPMRNRLIFSEHWTGTSYTRLIQTQNSTIYNTFITLIVRSVSVMKEATVHGRDG